ncbi:carbohydrate-binding module family 63 protein [Acidomyces richmondensis BFW]|nr:MAG: carbohydrate-binding module family 63 protein [Acidomyces sp. 'richmondensis']KYG44225.1 carbohydrate-binding module family 63 protein [Acidomyces richmondensis BFW]
MPEASLDERSLARRSLSGQATFYGGNVQGGACSFSTYTLPSGLMGTALSSSNWDDSAECGGCVNVHYGGKSITAMIVDECPGCGQNHLDLFPDAFAELAEPSKGIIDVTWDYVPCPHISGPLEIHMKSGVSEYWFSAQVVNARRRTSKMEVSTDQGKTWRGTDRQTYNFFEISSGVGASTAWVRVTSHVNTVVVVKDVPMTSNAVKKASKNYA